MKYELDYPRYPFYPIPKLEELKRHSNFIVAQTPYGVNADYLLGIPELLYPKFLEVRGLLYNPDGSLKVRAMHKFFNLNEFEAVSEERLKNLRIISAHDKVDGSLVWFFPHGEGFKAKTRKGFDNLQVKGVEELFSRHEGLRELIEDLWQEGLVAFFEYVAPDNQVVIPYRERELYLLQIRDNFTGRYLAPEEVKYLAKQYGVKTPDLYPFESVEEVRRFVRENDTADKEGFVLRFENDLFVKVKFPSYVQAHKVLSNLNPKKLKRLILEGKDDDLKPFIYAFGRNSKKAEEYERIRREVLEDFNRLMEVARKFNAISFELTPKEYAQKVLSFVAEAKEMPLPPGLLKGLLFAVKELTDRRKMAKVIKDFMLRAI